MRGAKALFRQGGKSTPTRWRSYVTGASYVGSTLTIQSSNSPDVTTTISAGGGGSSPWTSGSGFLHPTVTTDDIVIGASAQTAATVQLDIQGTGTAKANFDPVAITNKVNAADMDGTATSILFNQYYYDASTPAIADMGRLKFATEQDWTSTASTQDASFAVQLAENGTLANALTLGSDGAMGAAGLITASGGLTMHTSQVFTMGGNGVDDILTSSDSVSTADDELITADYVGTHYAPVAITGTVTSVAIGGNDGIDIDSGSPITTAGTIQLGLSNIPNASLANSSVSYGGVSVALGASDATPAFDLADATNYEGTAVKSTGEGGGSKFLREDGDGTSSWQTVPGSDIAGGANYIAYFSDSDTITGTAGLQYDGSNVTVSGTTSTEPVLTLMNKNNDAFSTQLHFKKNNSGSAADGDDLALIKFYGYNNATTPEQLEWAKLTVEQDDISDGSEDTTWKFRSRNQGTYEDVLVIDSNKITTGIWNGTAITNAYLANSSLNYGGVTVSLGGSDTTPAFDLSDATNYEGTAIKSTGEGGGSKFLREDGDGTCSWQTPGGGGTVTSVAIGGNDGIDVDSGSPITTAGTIQLGLSNIPNGSLANTSVNYGGVTLALGASDTTPAFDLADATGYTGDSALVTVGTITSGVWNGTAITNANLANDSVSYGGVSVDLGASDSTPAFDLSDATNYEGTAVKSTGETGGSKFLREDGDGTCSWQTPGGGGTVTSVAIGGNDGIDVDSGSPITTAGTIQLGLSNIPNGSLANNSVNYGGVTVALGGSDTTPAFDLADATNYEGTAVKSTGETGGNKFLMEDGDGTSSWQLVPHPASVTSVAIAGTDGIDVDSGSPITSAGTITLGLSNIANSKLANSSVSYGGVSVALGASDATPAFDLSDATAYTGDSSLVTVGTVTSGVWQGTAVDGAYVDIEGTEVKSTGETGGNKFLREDGDGTCSWQSPGGGGTVTSVAIGGNDGIDVDSGSPITSAGTIQLGLSNVPNASLANSSVSYGGVSVALGASDATPAFDLSDATAYTGDSSLVTVGTVTSGVWNGTAIANGYLANSSVSYGGVSVALGASDATPAFDLSDATAYTGDSSLVTVGTVTSGVWNGTAITNANLANSSVSYGGVSVSLGASDATPAFDLSDATNYEGTAIKSTGEGGGTKFLREDGDGTCSWQTPAGGGGSPGGSDTQIQYNDGGSSFGGISTFVWDDTDLKIDSDTTKLKFGDGQDMSIWHNGTDNYISGATGDIVIKNSASNEDIIFNANDGGAQTNMMTMDASLPSIQQHVGSVMDATKPTPSTGNDTITMTHATPFYSVTCDANVTGFPPSAKTDTLVLPAWEEGAFFRIAMKCRGAGMAAATIKMEASGSELINEDTAAVTLLTETARTEHGIAEVYACEVFGDNSTSTKVETWIVQVSPSPT